MMKLYHLHREQVVPVERDEVFRFFEQPENLARITPPSMDFVILTPTPISMKEGAVIDYTVKALGARMHWRTLITDYEPPHKFVDVQIKGPYILWHHTHRFIAEGAHTRLIDDVRYALPFGPFGRMAHTLLVQRQLKQIFDHRHRVVADMFGSVDANAGAHSPTAA